MCEKNGFKEVNLVSGILRERDILELPSIELTGGKGPTMERLIPILARWFSGPQEESHSGIKSFPFLSPGASGQP